MPMFAASLIAILTLVSPQRAITSPTHGDEERAIALAVDLEIHANRLEGRSDICLGLGHGLDVDGGEILAELSRWGVKVHPDEWCNRGPRGVMVSIIPPMDKSNPDTFKLVIQLGDLESIRRGEPFAVLSRRGTYTIQILADKEPELIGYQKTCCPE